MKAKHSVSVIIPVYNEEKLIEKCLHALTNQTMPPKEIIVVDNNCTDRTIAIAKNYPVRIIRETTQGMTPARNAGFDAARGDILARIDADTVVGNGWVEAIKNRFERDSTLVGLSGPATHVTGIPLPPFVLEGIFGLYTAFFFTFYHQGILFGANCAIRQRVWKMIRTHVCVDDTQVHEDIDLSLHIAPFGSIEKDTDMAVEISGRRYVSMSFYTDYVVRFVRTLRHDIGSKTVR